MSAEIENGTPGAGSILTTNFDTYTLILQLVSPLILVYESICANAPTTSISHSSLGLHFKYCSSVEKDLQSSSSSIC
jgi:hypothetical protein